MKKFFNCTQFYAFSSFLNNLKSFIISLTENALKKQLPMTTTK